MPNPYKRTRKTKFVDKLFNVIGTALIGSPSSLTDGVSHMQPGFYFRATRRVNVHKVGLKHFRALTAFHGFRVELTHKIAVILGGGMAAICIPCGLIIGLMVGGK